MNRAAPALRVAVDLLEAELAGGHRKRAKDLLALARAAGVSPHTLRRARRHIGAEIAKDGWQGEWVWWLPARRERVLATLRNASLHPVRDGRGHRHVLNGLPDALCGRRGDFVHEPGGAAVWCAACFAGANLEPGDSLVELPRRA